MGKREELIKEIEEALYQLHIAEKNFDLVEGKPELIDNALMQVDMAKNKYIYLLNQAKKMGIKKDINRMYIDLLMAE